MKNIKNMNLCFIISILYTFMLSAEEADTKALTELIAIEKNTDALNETEATHNKNIKELIALEKKLKVQESGIRWRFFTNQLKKDKIKEQNKRLQDEIDNLDKILRISNLFRRKQPREEEKGFFPDLKTHFSAPDKSLLQNQTLDIEKIFIMDTFRRSIGALNDISGYISGHGGESDATLLYQNLARNHKKIVDRNGKPVPKIDDLRSSLLQIAAKYSSLFDEYVTHLKTLAGLIENKAQNQVVNNVLTAARMAKDKAAELDKNIKTNIKP